MYELHPCVKTISIQMELYLLKKQKNTQIYHKGAKQPRHAHILITSTSQARTDRNLQIPEVRTPLAAYLHLRKPNPTLAPSYASLFPSPLHIDAPWFICTPLASVSSLCLDGPQPNTFTRRWTIATWVKWKQDFVIGLRCRGNPA